jgi:CBS domain containing-hemolysin-like protein
VHGAAQGVIGLLGMARASSRAAVHSEEELKMLVTASQEAGVLEEQEEQMLHRVFGFADLTAGQVMIPRTELAAVSADTTLPDLVRQTGHGRHARLPVYRADLDDVIGMLHVPDLLKALASGDDRATAGSLAREVLTVPETLGADDLLAEMRRRRVREAIVIDEYGGTAGLVTMEDLIEELVGEIVDEFDVEAPLAEPQPDGSVIVTGLMALDDADELLGAHLPDGPWDTVGGLVLDLAGRVPRAGESVEVDGFRLVVDRVDGHRIGRVRIVPLRAPSPSAPGD